LPEVHPVHVLLGLGLASKTDGLAAHPAGDDVLEPDKGSPTDEQDVARVHLNVLLLRMLASALWWNVGDRALEHLQERLLHALARDVAGNRDVVCGLADLVDLIDVDDAPLGGFQIKIRRVQELEQDVLDVLADIAGLGQGRGVADRKGNVKNSRQGPRQQRLAATVGPISKMFDLSSSTSWSGSSP